MRGDIGPDESGGGCCCWPLRLIMAHELRLPGRLAGLKSKTALLDTELPGCCNMVQWFSSGSPVESGWKSWPDRGDEPDATDAAAMAFRSCCSATITDDPFTKSHRFSAVFSRTYNSYRLVFRWPPVVNRMHSGQCGSYSWGRPE